MYQQTIGKMLTIRKPHKTFQLLRVRMYEDYFVVFYSFVALPNGGQNLRLFFKEIKIPSLLIMTPI